MNQDISHINQGNEASSAIDGSIPPVSSMKSPLAAMPELAPSKTLVCSLGEEENIDIYMWENNVEDHHLPVLVVHDLWEDLSYYNRDIIWWLGQKRRVYGINITYDGTYPEVEFPVSFQRMCIHFMQVLAHIRSAENMTSPIVYTKGIGALFTTLIGRKNAKFVSGMVAYSPTLFLAKPVSHLGWLWLKCLRYVFPKLMLSRFYLPTLSETSVETEGLSKRAVSCKIATRAIYEYLRAMKRSKRVCSRLRLPSLFILPPSPQVHDYSYLYEVQERYSDLMSFQMCTTPSYEALRSSSNSQHDSEFCQFGENIFLPWLEGVEDSQRQMGGLSIPEDNALPPDDLTGSLTSITEASKKKKIG
ncbi:MAG: alpha/beta hydrolase [Proteobacteria bacterium]|nr:alpha/beta hydrolase [Pseudomonadota bacterium]